MYFEEKSLKIAAKITAKTLSESGKLSEESAKKAAKFLKDAYRAVYSVKDSENYSKAAFKVAGKITAAAFEEAEDPNGKSAGEFFKTVYEGILPVTEEDFDENIFKHAGKITAAACEETEDPDLEKAEEAVCFFKALYTALTVEEVHGKYVTKETDAGFSFALAAGNHEVIGVSEVYTSAAGMKNGIESVRKNAPIAELEDQTSEEPEHKKNPKFEIYKDKAGEFRFRLKAANGEIILASEGYSGKAACEKGISSVRKNAVSTVVD